MARDTLGYARRQRKKFVDIDPYSAVGPCGRRLVMKPQLQFINSISQLRNLIVALLDCVVRLCVSGLKYLLGDCQNLVCVFEKLVDPRRVVRHVFRQMGQR